MRDFLIDNSVLIAWIISGAEFLLALLLTADFLKTRRIISLLMTITSLALTYDAFVLASGSAFSPELLHILSQIRFIIHGAVVPLILPIGAYALKFDLPLLRAVWAVTVILCCVGAAAGFLQVLEMRDFAGIVRFASADETPRWVAAVNRILSFGTVIPLILAGIAVIIREKNIFLCLSGVLMFAFSALGPATGNTDLIFLISMFGELFMVLFYLIFALTTHEEELL